ncbi:MAG: hypothetical protein M0T74_14520 [Desulfitobacterium hafniense]|nr:hypothetical protein [Desulfitobacterium hafniense]
MFSLKKSADFYKKAWGIFKASSGDYRILKLEALNAPTSGLNGDLACIQWYVNSEGKENDFYGISATMYVRRPNGQDVQIYPVPTTGTEATVFDDKLQVNSLFYVLISIIVILSGIGTIIFLKSIIGMEFEEKKMRVKYVKLQGEK